MTDLLALIAIAGIFAAGGWLIHNMLNHPDNWPPIDDEEDDWL